MRLYLPVISNFKADLFLLLTFMIFISSCTKEDEEPSAVACLNILESTIYAGETIEIQNCSENANEFTYTLNGTNIELEELQSRKHNPGNYTLVLEAVGNNGKPSLYNTEFIVRPWYESYYYPEEFNSNTRLLSFGNNPVREKLYAIYRDFDAEKYYYAEISENLEISKLEINSNQKNAYRAICSFEDDGVVYIDLIDVTAVTIERNNHSLNVATGFSEPPSIELVNYDFDIGYTTLDGIEYSVGANFENSDGNRKYIPAINKFENGRATTIKEFDFGEKSGVIGNIIPHKGGYLAYASSFDLLWDTDVFDVLNQKTILLELDTNFNLVKSIELSQLGENLYGNMASYNAPFHLLRLPDDKILCYGMSSLRILDNDLNIVREELLEGNSLQAVLLFDDAIFLSTYKFIKKLDYNGDLIAEFDYNHGSVHGIFPYKGNIIFMSNLSYHLTADPFLGTFFIGTLDKDLNLILPTQ